MGARAPKIVPITKDMIGRLPVKPTSGTDEASRRASETGDFGLSMSLGMATGNGAFGGLIGGDMSGGMIGGSMGIGD